MGDLEFAIACYKEKAKLIAAVGAAKARDRAAVAKYGEFATLNFKEGEKYDG